MFKKIFRRGGGDQIREYIIKGDQIRGGTKSAVIPGDRGGVRMENLFPPLHIWFAGIRRSLFVLHEFSLPILSLF